jgi:hypothetical protein
MQRPYWFIRNVIPVNIVIKKRRGSKQIPRQ